MPFPPIGSCRLQSPLFVIQLKAWQRRCRKEDRVLELRRLRLVSVLRVDSNSRELASECRFNFATTLIPELCFRISARVRNNGTVSFNRDLFAKADSSTVLLLLPHCLLNIVGCERRNMRMR